MVEPTGGLRTATRRALRAQVLTMVREEQPVSRAELARVLGLSRATLAALVDDLIGEGLITQAPGHGAGARRGRGRPPRILALSRVDGLVVGIDIGHQHARLALADAACRILGEDTVRVDVDAHADVALDTVSRLYVDVLDAAGRGAGEVHAAAAGIPGPVDAASGAVQSATILASWVDRDLRAELSSRIGLAVLVDNDANLGALGEMARGAARGRSDFIYIKASNGIGAGLVFGGKVYRGADGIAGEIGHTQLDPAGDWCRCGNRGCLEVLVSVDAVRRQLSPLRIDPFDGEADHPVARKVLTESGRTVGLAVANLCNALNPEAVVLGGDLSAAGEAFVSGVRESVVRLAQPKPGQPLEVVQAKLGRRSELIGAVTLAANSLAPTLG